MQLSDGGNGEFDEDEDKDENELLGPEGTGFEFEREFDEDESVDVELLEKEAKLAVKEFSDTLSHELVIGISFGITNHAFRTVFNFTCTSSGKCK